MNYSIKCKTVLSGVLLLAGVAQAQQMVIVKGKVNGDTQGYNKVYVYGTGVKQDSTIISNGSFELKIPYQEGVTPLFYTEYSIKVSRMYKPFPAVIDGPGVLSLNDIDIAKGINSGKWSGIKSAEDYQAFDNSLTAVYAEINTILAPKYPQRIDLYKDPAYRQDRDSLSKIKMATAFEQFVTSHPDAYASAYALSGLGRSTLKTEDLERIYGLLSPKRRQSKEGQIVAGYLSGLKSSTPGSFVKDFTLNTPEEKALSFSSLKGKYVLIDFWASWCGPCKASFPHMKEVYQKYKSDKFEIYSISIDKDKAAWLKELKVQGLPWLHSLDTKNISQSGFAVTGVPTTYLIDPQGKILMKEVGFEAGGKSPLEKKLIELFGDKGVTAVVKEEKKVEGSKTVPMMRMQ
jgi:thiol-disulfide isomerase/thioredoxin